MSYSVSDYERAKNELYKRRESSANAKAQRHDEVASVCPELLNIEKEMSQTALSVIRSLSMGDSSRDYVEALSKANLSAQEKRKKLLHDNGFPDDYLKEIHFCDICEDKGFLNGKMCSCQKALLRSYATTRLNEISPASSCTFDNFSLDFYPDYHMPEIESTPRKRMSMILSYCKNYAADFDTNSPSIFMRGETGLGKTHLSLAIAMSAIEKDYAVIYASAQNILSKLEKEKFGKTNTYESTESTLLECDLLVLDDLGTEFSTQFTVSAVYNIINTRLLQGLPTIINTNLSDEELEAKYSSRITSRIVGNYDTLNFFGKDIRQIKNY